MAVSGERFMKPMEWLTPPWAKSGAGCTSSTPTTCPSVLKTILSVPRSAA